MQAAKKHYMRIGQFMPNEHGIMRGRIQALGLGIVDAIFVERTSSKGKPYYSIKADPDGVPFEIGSAWPKVSKKGVKYYSVRLDTVLNMPPINAALFLDETTTNTFVLLWDKPVEANPESKAGNKAEANAEANDTGKTVAPVETPLAEKTDPKPPKKQRVAAMAPAP